MTRHVVVVGAGIVGLAVAAELVGRGNDVTVLEKEHKVAAHQTGRNSGVIHSGIYYKPGSLKAQLSRSGSKSMKLFAADHGIECRTTGKLIVAASKAEIPELRALADRAKQNGIEADLIDDHAAQEIEPHVSALAAIHVHETGIIQYADVCESLRGIIQGDHGQMLFGSAFEKAETNTSSVTVHLVGGEKILADGLINCAGLECDEVAKACGLDLDVRIIPFRGEYFELDEQSRNLVNGLIYPVPDARFPFLGVHLTKMIDGSVHAGPNAVLAFAREGYTWRNINMKDLLNSITWPGLWHLALKYWRPGAAEMMRSWFKPLFARSLARLVPEIHAHNLIPAPAGVRAQAVKANGDLVDDFLMRPAQRQLHVLNAPSPAATASLEIAKHVADEFEAVMNQSERM